MTPRSEPQPALGLAIKQARKARRLSQEELGLEARIHPTWISHIESGRNNPAWGSVRRIATALELRVSTLAAMAEELEGIEPGQRPVEETTCRH
jgi:transcriptional regulator with XRE-family HTH domain